MIVNLSEHESAFYEEMKRQIESGNFDIYNELFAEDYKAPLCPPDEFLSNPFYMNDFGQQLYPKLKDDFKRLFTTFGVMEVILAGSQRWGKNYFAINACARMLHDILLLKRPQEFFGIGKGTKIYVAIFSISGKKARSEFFDDVKRVLDNGQFFKQFRSRSDLETEVRFTLGDSEPDRGDLVFCFGNSTELSAFGQNIVAAFIDEANFLPDVKNSARSRGHGRDNNRYSAALSLYNSVFRRMKTTYGTIYGTIPGKFFLISSQKHEKDFINTRIEQAEKNDDKSVFILRYAAWDTNPKYEKAPRFKVGIHGKNRESKILTPADAENDFQKVIYPPIIYRIDFENDFFGAMCDIAGERFFGRHKFINRLKIPMMFTGAPIPPIMEKNIVDLDVEYPVVNVRNIIQNAAHFGHLDLAETGDNAGFAAGYLAALKLVTTVENDELVEVNKPLIVIDFLLTITPPKNGQIDFDKIYQLIVRLSRYKMYFKKITFDRFQSTYLMQKVAALGIDAGRLSLDRTPEPYINLRDAINQERVKSVPSPVIVAELGDLEQDPETKKVDHTAEGSKDLADCVAAVVHNITTFYLEQGGDAGPFAFDQSPAVTITKAIHVDLGSGEFKIEDFSDSW